MAVELAGLSAHPSRSQTAEPSAAMAWLQPPAGKTADQYLEAAGRAREAYLGLDRPRADPHELLRHKFEFAFWRRGLLGQLVDGIGRFRKAEQEAAIEALVELGIRLPGRQLQQVARGVRDPQLLERLLVAQGRGAGRAGGPNVDLKIRANRSSAWPLERWAEIRAFSEYDFEDEGVRYRGLHLLPGDVLLSNVNLDGNGLYTVLADPRSFCSHAAVFAILEQGGRSLPAVIETYEKGVRAVPLSVFLGARFSAYTEVYRHRAMGPAERARLNRVAPDMLRRVQGYNFDTEDPRRDYQSCTSVPRFLLEDAGIERIATKSRLADPQIQRNLEQLGYTAFDFFAPVDYMRDEGFSCVGWMDNDQMARVLTRDLVESRFRGLFSQRAIDPGRLPLRARINRWGIGHIRRSTRLGRLISRVEGFDHVSLPRGPDDVIALIAPAEAEVGRVIRRTHPLVTRRLQGLQRERLAALQGDGEVQGYITRQLDLPWLVEPSSAR